MIVSKASGEAFDAHKAYHDDIPIDLATRAHSGTSHSPDVRGEQERQSYAFQLIEDFELVIRIGSQNGTSDLVMAEFNRYRDAYRTRYLAMLSAKSRCVSTMIAGPSNFTTRRASKASYSADCRTQELIDFRTRALTAIRKVLAPSEGPIMSGDSDAVSRLKEKLAKAERFQERVKEINSAIKRATRENYNPVTALRALGLSQEEAEAAVKPDCFGNIGIAPYRLTNNAAEIRRLKKRIEQVSTAKLAPVAAVAAEDSPKGIRLEDDPAANRVRLFFPGKPSESVRSELKAHAFRWTPTLGAWQAFRNHRSLEFAGRTAGLIERDGDYAEKGTP